MKYSFDENQNDSSEEEKDEELTFDLSYSEDSVYSVA